MQHVPIYRLRALERKLAVARHGLQHNRPFVVRDIGEINDLWTALNELIALRTPKMPENEPVSNDTPEQSEQAAPAPDTEKAGEPMNEIPARRRGRRRNDERLHEE